MSIVFTCKSCDGSLVVDFFDDASERVLYFIRKDKACALFLENDFVKFDLDQRIYPTFEIYPKATQPVIPDYLSDIVSKNFREAKELYDKNYFNPSAMTSRRTIDLATKELLPEHTGMLNGRLKLLLDKNVITQQLFDWANIIRLDGNSANHDYEDFTAEQAKQLLDFTEMFLMYGFTLPKMVEIKRSN